ncbi:MAG: OmpA family protein [Acidobacteria bacterium]|nr:OmpA family protein [Acidobacteriota bacterium]
MIRVLAALLAGSGGMWAMDCAPLGHPTAFAGEAVPQMREYDVRDFPRVDGTVTVVRGRACSNRFSLQAGAKEPKPEEIVAFYKAEMTKLGAKVLLADSCLIVGTLGETWMMARCEGGWGSLFDVQVVTPGAFRSTLEKPTGDDLPWFGHLPGYTIVKSEKTEGSDDEFPVGPELPPIKAQGRRRTLTYEPTGRPQPASDAEVIENYRVAMRERGGAILFAGPKDLTVQFEDEGPVWVRFTSLFGVVTVTSMEEGGVAAKKQEASGLQAALEAEGHVAMYVNFDFGKATLKPAAGPVMAQVVSLLKANPGYRLTVEGHTDSVGGAEANLQLSAARAAAVVAEFVKGGVAAERLQSSGVGAARPIASNETSEGRAKNRRVELVK